MTKTVVIKLFVPFFTLTLTSMLPAYAKRASLTRVEDIEWRGHAGVESLLYTKPSGLAGTSRFQIPHAGLEMDVLFSNRSRLELEASFQSPVTVGTELNIERAAIVSPLNGNQDILLRAGLLEPEWLKSNEAFWPWDRYSKDLTWSFQRWGYTSASDYGFEVFHRGKQTAFGLSMVNGEGRMQTEQGAQKDFQLWVQTTWRSECTRTDLLLYAIRGGYENVPTAEAAKERYAISIKSAADLGLLGGVEYLVTSDPADSVTGRIADAVDLTDLGGQRVNGQVASGFLGYRFAESERGSQWQVFARADQVSPMRGAADRALVSTQWGVLYSSEPGIDWLFHVSNLAYGDAHSNSRRDENSWRLSYHVSWD